MGEIDDMRAIIEASIVAHSPHGEKMRALDALYHLRARAEAAEQRAEAAEAAQAQARADRDLMTGLWLATAPMDMLTETLPADRDSRNLLAAVISELDLHPNGAAHTDAGRAVIERIVAEAGGGPA